MGVRGGVQDCLYACRLIEQCSVLCLRAECNMVRVDVHAALWAICAITGSFCNDLGVPCLCAAGVVADTA